MRLREGLARELERDGSSVLVFTMFPGFVRTAMTEGLIATEARADWQPFVVRTPSRATWASCRRTARRRRCGCWPSPGPELNGCSFDVETDFEEVDRRRAEIARERLLTMRLRPIETSGG